MSVAREWLRYIAAGLVALGVDFGTYVALIRLAEVNYLLAAPAGFALGLATIYAFSIRWIFAHRRVTDRRVEFGIFALIGLGGMALNQFIIYACVEWLALSYELAKVVSAALVFCFNFAARKTLLFTRYS